MRCRPFWSPGKAALDQPLIQIEYSMDTKMKNKGYQGDVMSAAQQHSFKAPKQSPRSETLLEFFPKDGSFESDSGRSGMAEDLH